MPIDQNEIPKALVEAFAALDLLRDALALAEKQNDQRVQEALERAIVATAASIDEISSRTG